MYESVIGSAFEMSLRILLMLNVLSPTALDEHQIGAIDFISVYAADFGLLDENLHGNNRYRYSEYPARMPIVTSALRNLVLDGYVQLHTTPTGFRYSIMDAGKLICSKLTSNYAEEYKIAVQAVLDKFDNADVDSMLKAINKNTIQSIMGGLA